MRLRDEFGVPKWFAISLEPRTAQGWYVTWYSMGHTYDDDGYIIDTGWQHDGGNVFLLKSNAVQSYLQKLRLLIYDCDP